MLIREAMNHVFVGRRVRRASWPSSMFVQLGWRTERVPMPDIEMTYVLRDASVDVGPSMQGFVESHASTIRTTHHSNITMDALVGRVLMYGDAWAVLFGPSEYQPEDDDFTATDWEVLPGGELRFDWADIRARHDALVQVEQRSKAQNELLAKLAAFLRAAESVGLADKEKGGRTDKREEPPNNV